MAPKKIQQIIKTNASLLILDGLDEIAEKTLRRRVLDNITSCVEQIRNVLEGDLKVVATTRPYGYSKEFDVSQYLHLELQTLERSQAEKYTIRWSDVRESNPNESKRIKTSFAHCVEDSVIKVLTQTPLQITIILVLIRARGMPPKQREELFERYMDTIYQREQKKHPALLQTERDIIYGLHQYLAYILHKRAEKDKTAVLMDISDFKTEVTKFLSHKDRLLTEQEREDKTNQIIREAHQRLVLIESPAEGKVGFGLTPIREFFAAAYLFARGTNTRVRDAQFKAIAKSPHWRNVALFFAGRIGRILPGEASSMIDVCRSIDTEGADVFLKRGAEFVMEIVTDRALREQHNEISALEYALEILDTSRLKDTHNVISKLKNLPEKYQEHVVRPWLEGRMRMVTSENLQSYITVYYELFGKQEFLITALKKASKCDVQEVKLWVLSQTIKVGIVETWTNDLLKDLLEVFHLEKIALAFGSCDLYTFQCYLNYPLSISEKIVLTYAIKQGIDGLTRIAFTLPPEGDYSVIYEVDFGLLKIPGQSQHKEFIKNVIFMEAIALLVLLSKDLKMNRDGWQDSRFEEQGLRDWFIKMLSFPGIIQGYVRDIKLKHSDIVEKFCITFSEEKDPFTSTLVKLFEFLLTFEEPEAFISMVQNFRRGDEDTQSILQTLLQELLSLEDLPEDREQLRELGLKFYTLSKRYESEKTYKADIVELQRLLNKESSKISLHPHKLFLWLYSGCLSDIEQFLDVKILSELKNWIENHDIPYTIFPLSHWGRRIIPNSELCELSLEILDRQLTAQQKQLSIFDELEWYYVRSGEKVPTVPQQFKCVFEKGLANADEDIDNSFYYLLNTFYGIAFKTGVIEKKHLRALYEIVKDDPDFTPDKRYFYQNMSDKRLRFLLTMLSSDDLPVARLAAVSLNGVCEVLEKRGKEEWISEMAVRDKLWEFAKNTEDPWQSRYIRNMAQFQLRWSKYADEWFAAMRNAHTKSLQHAWKILVGEGKYLHDEDRDVLFTLLLRILKSQSDFAPTLCESAFQRLHDILPEVETLEFDEASLNLLLMKI